MKSFLMGLFALALVGSVQAASTDTAEGTIAAIAVDMAQIARELSPVIVPVEQKVVELRMTSNPIYPAIDASKRKKKVATLPYFRSGTCSGSFINDSGDILTARHCVDGFDEFEVLTYDQRVYTAVVVATSAVHDLALLHVDRRNTAHFELAETVTRGQTISALGSPLGITDTLSTGVVAKLEGDAILIDCSALPGNSGGPLFDANQRLVGVVNAGLIWGFGVTHLNKAVGLDAVHFFLKKALDNRN